MTTTPPITIARLIFLPEFSIFHETSLLSYEIILNKNSITPTEHQRIPPNGFTGFICFLHKKINAVIRKLLNPFLHPLHIQECGVTVAN
jgi:hypothetical protein